MTVSTSNTVTVDAEITMPLADWPFFKRCLDEDVGNALDDPLGIATITFNKNGKKYVLNWTHYKIFETKSNMGVRPKTYVHLYNEQSFAAELHVLFRDDRARGVTNCLIYETMSAYRYIISGCPGCNGANYGYKIGPAQFLLGGKEHPSHKSNEAMQNMFKKVKL